MFGVFRLFLALLVACCHLCGTTQYHLGIFAVFGFYTLSGYLITLVLHERYHFRAMPFFVNRALRIYPDYWLVVLLTLPVILLVPGAALFHKGYVVDGSAPPVLGNIFIVPYLFYQAAFKLIPQSWSIAVELCHYFLLWLVVARRRTFAIAAFLFWLGYHFWSLYRGQSWGDRYFPFAAAGLPFACGALIYFYRPVIQRWPERLNNVLGYCGLAIFSMACAASSVDGGISGRHFDILFYLSFGSLLLVSVSLSRLKAKAMVRIDSLAGMLSYPIYLCHRTVGFLVGHYLLRNITLSPLLFAASIPPILLCSAVLAFVTRKTVDPLRDGVRPKRLGENGRTSLVARGQRS